MIATFASGAASARSGNPSSPDSSISRNVGIAPIMIGRGISLWHDLYGFEADFDVRTEAEESGIVHVTSSRF